jgi:DUF4097 and DUF4098 domain-containing protein YvlB
MRPVRPPRSLAGPVVLILIGVFFLLGNMGVIEWHNLGFWFSRYWPALLILWGAIKLIEYQQANSAGVRSPGIGAGGVVLVVFLVMAGLSAHEAYKWDWHGWCDDSDVQGLPWCGHSYTYTDDLQDKFPAGATLHVENERGAVNISSGDTSDIRVSVHKRINADRQQQADEWNKSTHPEIKITGQVVTVRANNSSVGDHSVSTDLDISIPRKASVVVSTHHGDVSIMGRDGNANVDSEGGDVAVTDVNGSVTLNLSGSSARISQISSDVTVQGRAKDISLEDIKGPVRLDGDFRESVKLSRIAKPVSFKTSRTDMEFIKLDGYLNLDSGDLEANSLTGPLRLDTRSKDITLNGVTSDVRLKNENGAVEIHLNKLGNLDVSNSKGDIRVYVPEKVGFQVEAQARDGEIQSDFSSIQVTNGDNRSSAKGSVNGGGPRVVLNNEHGAIELRTGSIIPTPPPVPSPPKISHSGAPEPPAETEN